MSVVYPLSVFIFEFILVLIISIFLSNKEDRVFAIYITLISLLFSILKISLVQLSPQWLDTPPDMLTYLMNSSAIVSYLSYNYPGNANFFDIVNSSYEWLYPLYLSMWQVMTKDWIQWAIYSNAIFLSFAPIFSINLAKNLGGTKRISYLAGLITMLDPTLAINASWCLKDSLAVFLICALIWGLLFFLKKQQLSYALLSLILLCLLGCVRYVSMIAVILSLLMTSYVMFKEKRINLLLKTFYIIVFCCFYFFTINVYPIRTSIKILLGLTVVFLVLNFSIHFFFQEKKIQFIVPLFFIILSSFSFSSFFSGFNLQKAIWVTLAPSVGQLNKISRYINTSSIIDAKKFVTTHESFDSNTYNSITLMKNDPVKFSLRSVVKSLFSPLPGRFLKERSNFIKKEVLYIVGSLFWILCLPGLLYEIFLRIRMRSILENKFIMWASFLIIIMYIIILGEWSTRQRGFLLPILYVFAAFGWSRLYHFLNMKYFYFMSPEKRVFKSAFSSLSIISKKFNPNRLQ